MTDFSKLETITIGPIIMEQALRILNDLLASEIVSGKVKISKKNLPVPRMWLANPHSILRGGFSLSRAKAVFIPPAELVVVARSSYPVKTTG